MGTLPVIPARLMKASLNRGRSRRTGPILSPVLREIHLALILVSVILGGSGRCVGFNSPNRDAPSHLPPRPASTIQPPPPAAPRPRRTSSVQAAASSPSWLRVLDEIPGPYPGPSPGVPLVPPTRVPLVRVSPQRAGAGARRGGNHPTPTCRTENTSQGTQHLFLYPRVNEILLKSSRLQLETAANITVSGNGSCAWLTGDFHSGFSHGGFSASLGPRFLSAPCSPGVRRSLPPARG